MSSRRVLLAAIAPAVFLAGALAGCGGDTSSGAGTATDPETTSSGSPTSAGGEGAGEGDAAAGDPQCSDVWVDGEELPEEYAGCYEGEAFVDADGRPCAFGTDLFTYADSFYAAAGSRVNEVESPLEDAEAYLNAYDSCAG